MLQDPNLAVPYGIKDSSPLNALNYFHVADGLPPDFCHDLLEGFAVDIISNVTIALIKDGFFDLDDFNDIILNFEYSGNDKNNKPQIVKKKPLNSLRVKQTACEMWTLLRLLPLMMGHLIPRGNTVWSIYIKLLQIVELLCADEFSNSDLLLLQNEIDTFFQSYADVFQNVCIKPKGHYLQHYPAMIRKFGPLVKTLRFESKNGYFKSTFQASKNRKNVCFSIATRHQMHMYLNYCNSSILSFKESHGISTKEVHLEALDLHIREAIENTLILKEADLLCHSKAIVKNGQRYSTGDCVIIRYGNDEPIFGFIESAWHYQNMEYLLCEVLLINQFDEHFNSYEVENTGFFEMVNIENLFDYHPLSVYYVSSKVLVPLHHHPHVV